MKASTSTIYVGRTLNLSTSIHNGEGENISYEWYVDDAVIENETSSGFDFTKSAVGTYVVKVIASDGNYLYAVRYGSILSFSNDTGATWNTVDLSDSDSLGGFGAWGIACDSGYLYIAHSKGLIKGKIQ